VNPVITAMLRRLDVDLGPVTVRVPELEPLGAVRRRRPDLVLLKTATTLALSLAVAEEASGLTFLNPAAASSAASDKAAVLALLSAAGVPVPASYLIDPDGRSAHGGADPTAEERNRAGGWNATEPNARWVSKPVCGWHGAGVRFHETLAAALAADATARCEQGWLVDDGTRLVQRRVGAGEPDLKVYVAGEHMFATTKAFSEASFASDEVHPVELGAAQRDIVQAAGEALGLRLFGVDLRTDAAEQVVIDVNPFPGFRGFPAAVPALLAEIDRVSGRSVDH
jgi:ribosomal protein S6--L-glutamate ligase